MGSEGSSALFQRSYRSSMDRASTQLEGFDESHVVLDEDVHKLFGPAVSVTPEYIAAYRPSEELGGTDEVTAGVWDVPQPVGDAEDENATSSRHPATHQASLGSQYAERLDGQQHLPSYQDETYDNDTYDETYDSSDDDGAEDRKAEASKKADTRTEAAAPKTTLQWLYQLAGGGAELQKEQKEPQPSNSAGFQPRRPRPPPKKKQVSITQAMLFHNTST